jgi:membrane fusion protein, multidrug efflux system
MACLPRSTCLCNREHKPVKRIILTTILAACSSEEPSKAFQMPPVAVETAQVKKQDVALFFEEIGTIKPYQVAEVKSQVAGMITEIHFQEGSLVEKGSLLYTIDETPYKIRLHEAEAVLMQNRAHLKNKQKKLERYKALPKPELIAAVDWDELNTKIALCEAQVLADEAKLSAAQLDLQRCSILAPISGIAGKTSLQVGNQVGSSTLVQLSQMEPLVVEFEMTESERSKCPEGAKIEVYKAGETGEECLATGKMTFIDHGIGPKSGMIAAKGILSDLKKPLWSEQGVRVHIVYGKKEGAMLIPLKAIKTNQQGPYVFLVKEDESVEIRPVQLGPEEKGFVAVDLEEGKVVTEGHGRLFPGAKIKDAE